ncbi:MAG: YfhO family protein [Acidobacteria bacterium]|nr:YfhO family protein [Acidobacteriota bacterium]MBI3425323.1 YfhO family protein [Acidobacteriota bacterium]
MTPVNKPSDAWPRWLSATVFILAPLLYFFPAVLGQVTLAPGDGWSQIFGIRVLIGQMLQQGMLPLWNPYIFAGMPLLASIQPGALYPPTWVFAVFSPQAAMNLMVITTYHLALLGAYLYARRIGQTRLGALVAGLAFAFGGYLVAHLGHTNRIAAAAWLPWILLALEELHQRARWRWVTLGALFIALQLFAGEPQMTCYTIIVAGAYTLFTLFLREQQEQPWRYLGALAAMGLCGALLSMIQLLPEREMLHFSERAAITYEYFSQFSLPPRQILGFFFPYYFGGAALDPYKVPYWGRWNPTETAGYVGMLTWLLALVTLCRWRKTALQWFWLAWAVVAVGLALGDNLPFGLYHFLHNVPVYNLFRAPGRHLLEFNLALGLLAGFGITTLTELEARARWRLVGLSSAVLGGIVAVAVVIYCFFDERLVMDLPLPPEAGSFANPDIYYPVVFFGLGVLALAAYARKPNALISVAIVALVLLDAMSYGFSYEWRLPSFNMRERLADAPSVKFIKEREKDLNAFRILSQSPQPFKDGYEMLDFPNVSIVRGLQSVNGYDPLRLTRTTDIAGQMTLEGWVEDLSAFNPEHSGYDLLNVKYLLCEQASKDTVTYEGIKFNGEPSTLQLKPGVRTVFKKHATINELAFVSAMGSSPQFTTGTPVVGIKLFTTDGRVIEQQMQAGRDTAEWAYDRADVKAVIKHDRAKVIESWPEDGYQGHRYLARFKFDRVTIEQIELTYLPTEADLTITRAAVFDSETNNSFALDVLNIPEERWQRLQQFGTVTVFENKHFLPRAWFVRRLQMSTTAEVLRAIKTGKLGDGAAYDPREVALFEKELYGKEQLDLPAPGDPAGAEVKITRYEPQRLELQTKHAQPGFLVLSEMYYRGWDAFIDGRRVPVERVNYALRGLSVPAGEHRVEFLFRSPSFNQGARLAGLGVLILLLGAIAGRRGWGGTGSGSDLVSRLLRRRRDQVATAPRTALLSRLRASPGRLLLLALLTGYFVWIAQGSSFAVGGSDSSGYANIARTLLHGPLKPPVKELERFGLTANDADVFCPLAYLTVRRPGEPVVQTPFYPVGFPLHLAAAALLAGWRWGPYLVNPLLAALSLPLIFLIGLELGLPRVWAGAGAVMLAFNSTVIHMSTQPMSDVAAMFWALAAVWAGLRARRETHWSWWTGAAFGMAVLVRPTNVLLLAPLAFCLPFTWQAWLRFGLGGAPLGAVFCAYNLTAYGHPLRTGYGVIQLDNALMFAGFGKRLSYYAYWLAISLSPLPLLAWLGVSATRGTAWRNRALLLAWFGAYLCFYSCYDIYEAWGDTRFLLPGLPGLLLGALLVSHSTLANWKAPRRRWGWALASVLFAMTLGVMLRFYAQNQFFTYARDQSLNADACRWADAQAPREALLVSMQMSGALRFYTNRSVFRWEQIRPGAWPAVYRQVLARGARFYALLMDYEAEQAQGQVLGHWTEVGHLSQYRLWQIEPLDKSPPRAEFLSGFHGWEGLGEARWQWMDGTGVVRLLNTRQPMRLRVAGQVPGAFARPTVFKLFLNGALLEEFAAPDRLVGREYLITPAQQGSGEWSELRLQADQTVTPSQANPKSRDDRALSFSLTKLLWEEAAATPPNSPKPAHK